MMGGRKIWFGIIAVWLTLPAFACLPEVSLGDVVSFCQGNALTLNATNQNATYYWSTGATTPTLTVNSTGTYWVAVTNGCGTTLDTVEVVVDLPLAIDLGGDRVLCTGTSHTLTPPYSPSYSYIWQDGSDDSTYTVTQPGTYFVEVNNACGTFYDTVVISFQSPPMLNLGKDVYKCDPSPAILSAGNPGHTVTWSTGATGNSITVNTGGTYWARVTNACGTFYDTVVVRYSKGSGLNLGGMAYLCAGGNLTLNTKAGNGTYLWSTGATTPAITITQAGMYWVQFSDFCGTFYDTVQVLLTGPANTSLGADTTICAGQTLVLDALFPGSDFIWSTGATTQSIAVTTTGVYWVGVDNGCGFSYDTIDVQVLPVPYDFITRDVPVCPGTPVTVYGGNWGPQTSYRWHDGSTGSMHTFSTAGNYWVYISNACGGDTVDFTVVNDIQYTLDLGPDDTLCSDQVVLYAGLSFAPTDTILWSTGDTALSISVSSSGVYWVTVKNACGIFSDTIQLTFLNPPREIKADELSLCSGGTKTLSLPFQPGTSYLWSTGATTNSITVSQPGWYRVTAYNLCDTITDSVLVETDYPIQVDLGPDTVLCQPHVKVLDVSALDADSVRWSTGSRNDILPVAQTGTYWVRVYNACGVFSDTIQVTIKKLPEKKLSNRAFCTGNTVTLNATQPANSTYLWNTGATTPTITVSTGGWYYADITNGCGTIRDSAYVREDQPIPPIDLGKDTIFCAGTLTLDPGTFGGAAYLWQNGSTGQTLTVTQSGTYHVRVKNACNTVYDTINVSITGPPRLILGTVVKFCYGNVLTLNAQNPGSRYLWSTGETTQTIRVESEGIYWCTITNNCGALTDTVEVEVEYPMHDVDLGADTTICRGQTLVLSSGYSGARTRWSDGSRDPFLAVTETGNYWVQLENTCGKWSDTIHVEVLEIPAFNLRDTLICAVAGNLNLSGPPNMETYLWSTGATSREVNLSVSGTYWLTVSNLCFSYTDTFIVREEYPIIMDLGPDTVLCMTETYFLDPGIELYPVHWDDGRIMPAREVSQSGTYWAMARNSCGVFYDTVTVQFDYILDPPVMDTIVCDGDPAVFDLTGVPYAFEWFDGSREPVREFTEPGTYPLTITNKCGVFEKEFVVQSFNCECPLFIANAFSPNDDGVNDEFKVVHSCILSGYRLEIFSRWGERVFFADSDQETWDGTFNGEKMPAGVYSYRLQYDWHIYELDRHKTTSGSIVLLR